MGTQSELEKLVGHAIFDVSFRTWLFKDPEGAAKSLGIALDPRQADYLRKVGPDGADQVGKCLGAIMPPAPTWSG